MKIITFLNNDKEAFENEINAFLDKTDITIVSTSVNWNGVYFGVIEYSEVKA